MNSTTNNLPSLLDFLQSLMPPNHIVLVGAGNGKTPWAQWLNAQTVPATLAEADDQQFAALQRQQAVGNYSEQARLLHAVVAAEAGEVAFYTSNLATENGLLPSEDLQQLWPNLHTLQSSQHQAIALAQLLAPEAQVHHQWLLLDCLPAATLLQGAATALAQVDVVVARVLLTEPEHAGQPAQQPIPGASLAELKALLPEFTQLALQPSRHPAIAHVLLVRNYRKKQELQAQAQQALEADLAASNKARDAETQAKQAALQARDEQAKAKQGLQAQLQQAQQHNAELVKKQELQAQTLQGLEADLAAARKAKDVETQPKQAALQARDEQAKAKEGLQAQLQQAQQHNAELIKKQELQTQALQVLEADLIQLQKISITENFVSDLHKEQIEQLSRVRRFLDSSLKKEITNATKQIEAFVGLQSYLTTGELPSLNVERQSWPISPDFAFYLAELLEGNRYHLVVEFGSGQSTILMARILQKMACRSPSEKKPATVLVSFDHLEQYYQQTKQQLQQAGLSDLVKLHHTPLVDWKGPNGTVQPYYDCQIILAQLAAQYPDKTQLRMLVVVDGPPAATGKHARYPAGPSILQYFKGAQIDFLLDDYIREDEKEVAQRWKDEITAAQLRYTTRERTLEKDACLITTQGVDSKP